MILSISSASSDTDSDTETYPKVFAFFASWFRLFAMPERLLISFTSSGVRRAVMFPFIAVFLIYSPNVTPAVYDMPLQYGTFE